jgi:hypothetical protein
MPASTVLLACACLALAAPSYAVGSTVVLDETAQFHCYYRFATDLVSPAQFKAEGRTILGQVAYDRLQRETLRTMNQATNDFKVFHPSASVLKEARRVGTIEALRNLRLPAGADWRDFLFVRMFFDPYTAPPPPDNWAAPDFDDHAWPVNRPFQVDLLNDLPPSAYEGNLPKVHVETLQFIGTGIHSAYYRARFWVEDPAQAGDLTLRLVYRGGVRALVNGQEIGRGHLPPDPLAPETAAEDYPAAADQDPSLRDRALGPLKVPAALLVKGTNVLAIEIRASNLHPRQLARTPSNSWNALHDREQIWRHGFLAKVELRASAPAVASALRRPAGLQVWTPDIHQRLAATDFLPPGEPPGTVRFVGAQNGTCGGQLGVGTDKDVTGLRVVVSDLTREDGKVRLPAAAITVHGMRPFPAEEFGQKLGDERGLGATFPSRTVLAQWQRVQDSRRPYVFDQIGPAPPTTVPAGTCQPLWLSLRISADATPGAYRGSVTVTVDDRAPQTLPVEVEVLNWRLPDPARFQVFVGCEENPYGVAKQYGVRLWSDEHFRLLEASFRHLARIGTTWLNVPVIRATEFGNKDDSMIRWIRRPDGVLTFDYAALDRYLDVATRYLGKPRVINFVVMHGAAGGLTPPRFPEVTVLDQKTGRTLAVNASLIGALRAENEKAWITFAQSLRDHLKAKGLDESMCFGLPLDGEEEPPLRELLTRVLPTTNWACAPHQIPAQGLTDPHYKFVGSVRYVYGNWPGLRPDQGWKAPVAHLTIPRIDSSVQSLYTASHPFGFRMLVNHSLALGRAGFFRVGADEWAAVHFDGMRVPTWIVGMPVLFLLWPGPDGAESSARFEVLLEAIQEGEARIFLEQALDRGNLPADLRARVQQALSEHYLETTFFQNKLCITEFEKYHYRWQERSLSLYRAAASVAGRTGSA